MKKYEMRNCEKLLRALVQGSRKIFGEQLRGIYLHGSLAMGCFHPDRSDIDLIFVIRDEISDHQKRAFMEMVVRLSQDAPAKGIELSIVLQKYCRTFVYPTPFELHASPMHLQWFAEEPEAYVRKMKGTDKDLAAHFTMIQRYGIVLYGEPIREMFGIVPREDYMDSLWEDVKDAREDIRENPVYIILNLCRVLAFLQEDLYLSKAQGGEWGLTHAPQEFHALIRSALAFYQGNGDFYMEEETGKRFAEFMCQTIRSEMDSQDLNSQDLNSQGLNSTIRSAR